MGSGVFWNEEKKDTDRGVASRYSIYRAFLEELGRLGYKLLTIEAVVRRAAISKGRFYHHFRGKNDLAEKALRAFGADLLARLHQGLRNSDSPEDAILELLEELRSLPVSGGQALLELFCIAITDEKLRPAVRGRSAAWCVPSGRRAISRWRSIASSPTPACRAPSRPRPASRPRRCRRCRTSPTRSAAKTCAPSPSAPSTSELARVGGAPVLELETGARRFLGCFADERARWTRICSGGQLPPPSAPWRLWPAGERVIFAIGRSTDGERKTISAADR
jgi:AcrR family transcriptional regulator